MTAGAADGEAPVGLVMALYVGVKSLHTEAEKTGIIRDLLRGDASRDGYALLLRNLLPAYRALESGLDRHRDTPALAELASYDLDRAGALEVDLIALAGPDWATTIALLPEGEDYARHVADAAKTDGSRLIAHAYARYLGDLSGGQILQRLLAKSLDLTPDQLTFYDFPRFGDLAALKSDYRQALDRAGAAVADRDAVVAEGSVAFRLNIALSCAIKDLVTPMDATADAAE